MQFLCCAANILSLRFHECSQTDGIDGFVFLLVIVTIGRISSAGNGTALSARLLLVLVANIGIRSQYSFTVFETRRYRDQIVPQPARRLQLIVRVLGALLLSIRYYFPSSPFTILRSVNADIIRIIISIIPCRRIQVGQRMDAIKIIVVRALLPRIID